MTGCCDALTILSVTAVHNHRDSFDINRLTVHVEHELQATGKITGSHPDTITDGNLGRTVTTVLQLPVRCGRSDRTDCFHTPTGYRSYTVTAVLVLADHRDRSDKAINYRIGTVRPATDTGYLESQFTGIELPVLHCSQCDGDRILFRNRLSGSDGYRHRSGGLACACRETGRRADCQRFKGEFLGTVPHGHMGSP